MFITTKQLLSQTNFLSHFKIYLFDKAFIPQINGDSHYIFKLILLIEWPKIHLITLPSIDIRLKGL